MAASPASLPLSPSETQACTPSSIPHRRALSSSRSRPGSSTSAYSGAPTPTDTHQPNLTTKPSQGSSTSASQAATTQLETKQAMISAMSPTAGPASVTSKEWVIPPRPKPGRKPATDTPPTKRKAQNRAAQRAFRERRAARVGELEEQLDEQKGDHDRVERELRERVQGLEMEAQTLRTRCQVLENMLERERRVNGELDGTKQKWSGDSQSSVALQRGTLPPILGHSQHQHSSAVQQPSSPHSTRKSSSNSFSRRHVGTGQPFSISQIISPPDQSDGGPDLTCGSCKLDGPCACANEALVTTEIGCGKCTLGSRCECLEAIDAISTNPIRDLKRPHSPGLQSSSAPYEKRLRPEVHLETDFTELYMQKKESRSKPTQHARQLPLPAPVPLAAPPPTESLPPRDRCGFCKDGTYCICADTQSGVAPLGAILSSQQTQTPPPSETDYVPSPMEVTATGAIKLPSIQSLQRRRTSDSPARDKPAAGGTCGPGGPGTCAQCLADPISGLFCRSLAANLERQGSTPGAGCCGAAGPGGCCKIKSRDTIADQKPNSISLSCADTYKTLASHRHFDEASDDINNWLPMLKAAPRPDAEAAAPSRHHPMEVEAASIMSVLKGFEVRFGK